MHVAIQRLVQGTQETIEVPKVRITDDAVDTPVAMWRQVPERKHMDEVISGSTRQLHSKQQQSAR